MEKIMAEVNKYAHTKQYQETKQLVIAIRREFKNGDDLWTLSNKYHYSVTTIRHMLFGYNGYSKYNEFEAPVTSLKGNG